MIMRGGSRTTFSGVSISRPSISRLRTTATPRHLPRHLTRPAMNRRRRSFSTPAPATMTHAAVLKMFADLQQGSDIRGIALEGILDEPVTLTPIRLFFIAVGFAQWLSNKTGKPVASLRVSIGRDPRLSGRLVRSSVALGLASQGVTVTDFGLASTPAMFMSCILKGHRYDGAIMLTASHLPFNRNGMKFFIPAGGLDKPDIKEILQMSASACDTEHINPNKNLQTMTFLLERGLETTPELIKDFDFMPVYAAHLRSVLTEFTGGSTARPLKGFKIAVDAGNGAGGFVATDVLAPLGADVSGSQYLDPNGRFPNHIPNPEDADATASATVAVLKSGSDLGIIYDTDVDRSGVVDKTGVSINSNRMIALMSAIVLHEHPGTTIVTDSVTSNGLKRFIESHGGRHYRYKRGYKNVIGKGMELNREGIDCALMMETSGHGALKENYFLDDGAYMSIKIVAEMVRRHRSGQGTISDLIRSLKEPLEAKEFRLRIKGADFKEVALETTQRFHDFIMEESIARWQMEEENHEGWRVAVDEGNGKKGWCLLRPSIHDPLCVLNIESEIKGGLQQTASEISSFFSSVCQDLPIDASSLQSISM